MTALPLLDECGVEMTLSEEFAFAKKPDPELSILRSIKRVNASQRAFVEETFAQPRAKARLLDINWQP